MTLIWCPFFHCNYCNYCNWSVFSLPTIDAKSHRDNMFTDIRLARSKRILSVKIILWLSNTKNMHDSHCYHKTSSNFPVSESMINPRTTISFGTRG